MVGPMRTPTAASTPLGRRMLNKVPEVTIYFWIIKVLCTTIGETGADNLDTRYNLGLAKLTYITGGILALVLLSVFRAKRYIPLLYWSGIVLISVVGTLITDNLTDNHGVALQASTALFTVCLAATFAVWYASERTLSIHTVVTTRREAFYWITVLFTFSLGTAAGDLVAEKSGLGYGWSVVVFAAAIGLITLARFRLGLGTVLAFWLAYIMSRPLGASIGDYLSQPTANGGLGLGTSATSYIFLATIVGLVAFLTITKVDETPEAPVQREHVA